MTMAALRPGTVKICGNRDPELCQDVVQAGADLLGFIFVPGAKRYIDPAMAAECVALARDCGELSPQMVGVFADDSPNRINEIAEIAMLDLVQLHGSEPSAELERIKLPVIKVMRPAGHETLDQLHRRFDAYLNAGQPPIAFVIDGFREGYLGGAGIKVDWNMAAKLAFSYPLLLAGGLAPENVSDAITQVAPMGVDVSSGVETEGLKDPDKIRTFIARAKEAFRTMHLFASPSSSTGHSD